MMMAMMMLIFILTTFPFHQMPSRPKVWRLDSRCQVTSPLGISPEFDIGRRDYEDEKRHVLRKGRGYYERQMMKTWSVKSKLADCCKSIAPVSGSLNSSSIWWWLKTSTCDDDHLLSLCETQKHLSEAIWHSFRCDQQKMLAGREVAGRMMMIISSLSPNGYDHRINVDRDQDE